MLCCWAEAIIGIVHCSFDPAASLDAKCFVVRKEKNTNVKGYILGMERGGGSTALYTASYTIFTVYTIYTFYIV